MYIWHKETTPGTTGARCTIRDGSGLFVAECIASDAAAIVEAPAMLAALREAVARVTLANSEGSPILSAWLPDAAAILSRIDGAPTAQPAGDDPAITAAANLSRAALVEAAGEALALQSPISEAAPVQTFTAFCQEADGTGTIWIQQVKAETIADATAAARRDCAEDWGFDVEQVHCLGLARGDCQIVHWEDAAP